MNVRFIDRLTKNDRKKGSLNPETYVEVRQGIDTTVQSNTVSEFQERCQNCCIFCFFCCCRQKNGWLRIETRNGLKFIYFTESLLERSSEVKVDVTQVCALSFFGEEGKKILKNVVRCKVIVRRWLEDQYVFEMHIKNQMYVLVHFYCFSLYLICTSFHSISGAKKGLFKNLIALRSVTQTLQTLV